jgi:hypothetical protein
MNVATSPTIGQPLTGRVLLLARAVWIMLAASQLLSFLPLLPRYATLADHPCPQRCALTAQDATALTRAGFSPHLYVWLLFAATVFSVAAAMTMAILLFLRRSYDRMALIAAYFILILPTTLLFNFVPIVTSYAQSTAFTLPLALDIAFGSLQTVAIFGLFLVFPSGQFAPRWMWTLLVGFVVFTSALDLLPALQDRLILGWEVFFVAAIANIAYRYRRVSTPHEQQQTKWVGFGFFVFIVALQLYWIPLSTPLGVTIYTPLAYLLYELLLPAVPITFFIAIQRHRHYDIDAIIRRALIYGVLTAVLVAIYAACILGAQAVFGAIGGPAVSDSPLLIVLTTLVTAALFLPLRRRTQLVIDRRFYRGKYDAARVLAPFAAALQSDVDLEHVCDHLAGVVDETMRPAHVSIWPRPVEEGPTHTEHRTTLTRPTSTRLIRRRVTPV